MSKTKHLVCGAGGFIFGHLVESIKKRYEDPEIVSVDVKPLDEWYQIFDYSKNIVMDLEDRDPIKKLIKDFQPDFIWQGACRMGGMGYVMKNEVMCGLSSRMHSNVVEGIIEAGIKPHIFYSSSACVYNQDLQSTKEDIQLKEKDAIPANPDLLYGWEKLFAEKLYEYLNKEYGVPISIARFHNVYGPYGTYDGGKEKAPAAAIRKAVQFQKGEIDKIKIWGDGTIKRSFMYIDDAIEGIQMLVENGYNKPINLGSSEGVTIQALHDLACNCFNVTPEYEYDLTAPQGVMSRNSDNTLIKSILNWEPSYPLIRGMIKTAKWIEEEMKNG